MLCNMDVHQNENLAGKSNINDAVQGIENGKSLPRAKSPSMSPFSLTEGNRS